METRKEGEGRKGGREGGLDRTHKLLGKKSALLEENFYELPPRQEKEGEGEERRETGEEEAKLLKKLEIAALDQIFLRDGEWRISVSSAAN